MPYTKYAEKVNMLYVVGNFLPLKVSHIPLLYILYIYIYIVKVTLKVTLL